VCARETERKREEGSERRRTTRATTTVDSYGNVRIQTRAAIGRTYPRSLSPSFFCLRDPRWRALLFPLGLFLPVVNPSRVRDSPLGLQGTPVRLRPRFSFVSRPNVSRRVVFAVLGPVLAVVRRRRGQVATRADTRAHTHPHTTASTRTSRNCTHGSDVWVSRASEGTAVRFAFRAGIHRQCPLLTTEGLRAPTPGRRAPIGPTSAGVKSLDRAERVTGADICAALGKVLCDYQTFTR